MKTFDSYVVNAAGERIDVTVEWEYSPGDKYSGIGESIEYKLLSRDGKPLAVELGEGEEDRLDDLCWDKQYEEEGDDDD